MKVVLINDRLNAGGAEKVLIFVANLLYQNKVDVSVVLLLEKSVLDDQLNAKIPVFYLNRKSRFELKSFYKLRYFVKDADIVHIHSRYNLRYYMVAKILLSINKPKIFFHEHVPSFKLDFITKFFIQKVNAYVAVQEKMKDWAIRTNAVKIERAFYLANTVNVPIETDIKKHRSVDGKILMVANFREIKNQLFAISLLADLPKEYTLDLYGTVDEVHYFDKIKQKIKNQLLESRIRVVGGVTNIYDHLSKYKLAIHTATAETGPLVLVEYLNAGLPFITYNTGDVVNLVNQYLPEFIINDFNKTEWLNKIKMFNQKNNFDNEKIMMKSIIQQHFSASEYFSKLIFIYQHILS